MYALCRSEWARSFANGVITDAERGQPGEKILPSLTASRHVRPNRWSRAGERGDQWKATAQRK